MFVLMVTRIIYSVLLLHFRDEAQEKGQYVAYAICVIDLMYAIEHYMSNLAKFNLIEVFFFQAEYGIRDLVRSRGLGDVYKRQPDSSNPQICR